MNKVRRSVVAGNWKMHGTRNLVSSLLTTFKSEIDSDSVKNSDVIVFPPYVFLAQAQQILADSAIQWGGQNLAFAELGAYTGEVSATMLLEFGCRYVLVGHSERRSIYGETNQIVAQKFALAQKIGLQPILCLGETLHQREQGQTQTVIKAQLQSVLDAVGGASALSNAILAYEPVWAIGTGVTASPEQAQEVHGWLRECVASEDSQVAQQVRIIYGGSVKADNAKTLFAMPDVDGGLIGGASLQAQDFLQIYRSAL